MPEIEMPSGICSLRSKPGSLDRIDTVPSAFDTVTSTTVCRLSARFSPPLMNVTTFCAAEFKRSVSMPEEMDGNAIPINSAISATTTISSSSVTPAWVLLRFPTDNVGINSIAAGLAVRAIRDQVGLVAVLAGIFVDVRMPPWIRRDVLLHVWPLPVRHALGRGPQRLQTLLRSRERPHVELIRAQRRNVAADLRSRRRLLCLIRLPHVFGQHEIRKQADDHHDHQHFDERDAGFSLSSVPHT